MCRSMLVYKRTVKRYTRISSRETDFQLMKIKNMQLGQSESACVLVYTDTALLAAEVLGKTVCLPGSQQL